MSRSSLLSAAIRRGGGGAIRASPPSASAIVSRPVTGSHLLRIDGYTNTKSIAGTGKYIRSREFAVGGRKFELEIVDFKRHFSGRRNLIKKEELERSENILKDDCFTVRCDLTVLDDAGITEELDHQEVLAADAAGIAVPPSDLHGHLADLLWGKEGADVVVQLGDVGKTFRAHRWVLAVRSRVLKAKLSALPVSNKSSPEMLRLDAMDTEAFKALLHFIYTDTLPETKKQGDDDAMARRLFAAADTYKMERLKLICKEKLRGGTAVGNVAVTLALAEQHHCRELKEACIEFLSSPGNLKAAMATDGFQHLKATCPSVLMELFMKQLP
uniref:BTB domain-containing protein n=1 Tax=Oryza punctata TaxID=4537 RepID=A0A0E0MHF1_ORYPU